MGTKKFIKVKINEDLPKSKFRIVRTDLGRDILRRKVAVNRCEYSEELADLILKQLNGGSSGPSYEDLPVYESDTLTVDLRGSQTQKEEYDAICRALEKLCARAYVADLNAPGLEETLRTQGVDTTYLETNKIVATNVNISCTEYPGPYTSEGEIEVDETKVWNWSIPEKVMSREEPCFFTLTSEKCRLVIFVFPSTVKSPVSISFNLEILDSGEKEGTEILSFSSTGSLVVPVGRLPEAEWTSPDFDVYRNNQLAPEQVVENNLISEDNELYNEQVSVFLADNKNYLKPLAQTPQTTWASKYVNTTVDNTFTGNQVPFKIYNARYGTEELSGRTNHVVKIKGTNEASTYLDLWRSLPLPKSTRVFCMSGVTYEDITNSLQNLPAQVFMMQLHSPFLNEYVDYPRTAEPLRTIDSLSDEQSNGHLRSVTISAHTSGKVTVYGSSGYELTVPIENAPIELVGPGYTEHILEFGEPDVNGNLVKAFQLEKNQEYASEYSAMLVVVAKGPAFEDYIDIRLGSPDSSEGNLIILRDYRESAQWGDAAGNIMLNLLNHLTEDAAGELKQQYAFVPVTSKSWGTLQSSTLPLIQGSDFFSRTVSIPEEVKTSFLQNPDSQVHKKGPSLVYGAPEPIDESIYDFGNYVTGEIVVPIIKHLETSPDTWVLKNDLLACGIGMDYTHYEGDISFERYIYDLQDARFGKSLMLPSSTVRYRMVASDYDISDIWS